MKYRIQPAPHTDQICADGTELTQLPYPFVCDADGVVLNIHGIARVVGFESDLAFQRVDVWWRDFVKEIDIAKGMYVVTEDIKGSLAVHTTAVMDVEVREV